MMAGRDCLAVGALALWAMLAHLDGAATAQPRAEATRSPVSADDSARGDPAGDVPAALDRARARELPPLNAAIVDLAASYPIRDDGDGQGYMWPAPRGRHGTTRDLYLGRTRIARAGRGTHCVGLTFEVLWRVLEQQPGGPGGLGLDRRRSRRLRALWFVPDPRGRGPAEALPALDLGVAIDDPDQALPGDFVQFWMNGGRGHSAVFLSWLRDQSGQVIGLRYWSTQPWTDGIDVSSHRIGTGRHQVDGRAIFIGRVQLPASAPTSTSTPAPR
ncbi:MAG: hypothetical protein AAGC55_28100 [Myxococcota bacterium]